MDDGSNLKKDSHKSVIGKSSSHKERARINYNWSPKDLIKICPEFAVRILLEFSSTSVAVMENIGVFQVYLIR